MSLNPYSATVTGGCAGAGTFAKLLFIASETVASSRMFVSPNGRTVEQPANTIATAIVNKDKLNFVII
jgi:hypothetical protein